MEPHRLINRPIWTYMGLSICDPCTPWGWGLDGLGKFVRRRRHRRRRPPARPPSVRVMVASNYRGYTQPQGLHPTNVRYRGCSQLKGLLPATWVTPNYRGYTQLHGLHPTAGVTPNYRGYTQLQGLHPTTGVAA